MYAYHSHSKWKITFFVLNAYFEQCLEKKSPSKPGCPLKQVGEETGFQTTHFAPKCEMYFVIFIVTYLQLAPASSEPVLQ